MLLCTCNLGQKKKNICVSGFPTLPRFLPDPKHFIVNCEQNVVKFAGKWGKIYGQCNFYIKYFDKIKCYADRPYLVFSELKPETRIYYFFALCSCIRDRVLLVLAKPFLAHLSQRLIW